MKFSLPVVFVFLCSLSSVQAQNNPLPKHKIAIFAPLYLDSAFDSMDNYRYASNALPEFINPGLEFYEGVQLALDSLKKESKSLEVFIYDTKSVSLSIEEQLNNPALDSVELIIVHCSNNEVRYFAEAGLKKNIPVINVNLPNDAGVKGNPFYVILNSTLKTQCEALYRYTQKYFAIDPIVVFRKKGQMEDIIKTIFTDFGKNTVSVPLKIKYVDLPDSFTVNQLRPYLDSNRQTICIAGSMNENFGRRLSQQLASLNKKYPAIVMGMPTWDAIRDFNKPEYKDLEIIYGTPFYNAKTDKPSQSIINHFNTVMYARPTDMVYRGYEVTWKYAQLLMQYGKDLASNLSNKQHKVFTDFDIQPVLNSQTMTLDYFENKRIYFLKWQNGVIKSVNW
ncbi:MAG TPA: amino acid ABC transporter substrate-binding protein [Chitinophagaceae bacterium]